MERLLQLAGAFAILSVLAVGGGTAVLPEMKHVTTDRFGWMSAEQFQDTYSLGQLAPGPNMLMVTVIGYQVAGVPGALVATLAFFLPACALTFVVSRVWDHFRGSPWREAVQRGMAPVTIGLMGAGVYAIAHTAVYNVTAGLLAAAVTLILLWRHVNPVLLILIGAVIGFVALR